MDDLTVDIQCEEIPADWWEPLDRYATLRELNENANFTGPVLSLSSEEMEAPYPLVFS